MTSENIRKLLDETSIRLFGHNMTDANDHQRYKALCRTYHPDAESGDEETFKRMQAEYEERKKTLKTLKLL